MELDMDKGTLHFFHKNTQQPVYVAGIREKVRFFVCAIHIFIINIFYNLFDYQVRMYTSGSCCIVRSLKKLAAPTTIRLPNEQAVQW
jgi:hypothetical protein